VRVEALDFGKNYVITSRSEVILTSTNFILLTISGVFRLEILRTLWR
jgi:hypothetical protein